MDDSDTAALDAAIAMLTERVNELLRQTEYHKMLREARYGAPVRQRERPGYLRLVWSRPESRSPASGAP